ncbi:MAG: hypothetical protein PHW46_05210 [Candidatus Omnitrophica bacterium]|nr:hypothetical protein [Candidatus Omnitrophota bacterium]
MFEHYRQPLLSRSAFFLRVLRCAAVAFSLLVLALFMGTAVFHYIEQLSWIDSFLNSVFIMTGLGLMGGLGTVQGKLFSSFYALFSALIFYAVLAIIFTPLLHRLLHRMHLDIENRRSSGEIK